jgi:deoxyadenosine/deoxycytidine kinase
MMAYISRLSIMREAIKKDYDVIIMERSMFTDCEVFAKMLYDDKKIETIEYNIYKKWFDEFIGDFPEIHHIYIQAEPTVSSERVIKRGRQGETIPLNYLETCHAYHEKWLLSDEDEKENILLLDGNKEMNDLDYNKWLDKIEVFIKSKFEEDEDEPFICI